MSSPYPNAYQIEEMFANRDVPSIFNTYLADSVDVSVVDQDFYIKGHYKSPQAFHDSIWTRMTAVLKLETLRIEIARVNGAVNRLGLPSSHRLPPRPNLVSISRGIKLRYLGYPLGTCFSDCDSHQGEPLHNQFVDLVRFNSQGKIAQMKEFFDSEHVHRHVEAHEKKGEQAK